MGEEKYGLTCGWCKQQLNARDEATAYATAHDAGWCYTEDAIGDAHVTCPTCAKETPQKCRVPLIVTSATATIARRGGEGVNRYTEIKDGRVRLVVDNQSFTLDYEADGTDDDDVQLAWMREMLDRAIEKIIEYERHNAGR